MMFMDFSSIIKVKVSSFNLQSFQFPKLPFIDRLVTTLTEKLSKRNIWVTVTDISYCLIYTHSIILR